MSNETESVVKESPKKVKPRTRSTTEFYKTLKEELTPVFLKLFYKIERKGMLSKLIL
jgi:hypothetical protein